MIIKKCNEEFIKRQLPVYIMIAAMASHCYNVPLILSHFYNEPHPADYDLPFSKGIEYI